MLKKIRVLVVDDSDFQRGVITGILETDPEIEVIDFARNGVEAIEKTLKLKPDVITMDIRMPVMDGLQATREIMAERPTPILIVSVTVQEEGQFTLNCLKYGALDFVPITSRAEVIAGELISKVKMCSRIKVVTHPRGRRPRAIGPRPTVVEKYEIMGIAISTGGPAALHVVIKHLPKSISVPIIVVQHISDDFTKELARWLDDQCPLKVVEAKNGDSLNPGVVYLAPGGSHLSMDMSRRVELIKKDFPGGYHKPSANIMLESIAKVYGSRAIGIIMTGMGKDGVLGMKAISEAKGFTIAQDENTSVIFGMNKLAIDGGFIKEVLSLEKIAERIIELVG